MSTWFRLYAVLTVVVAQIVASFASPPNETTLCNEPPPYIGHASTIAEPTPFVGSQLFRPNDGRRHLSLILLHGSEGGSNPEFAWYARLWSKLGYSVLAYCYFDCARKPGALPDTLKNVETSKVLDAVEWLRQQPFSDGKVVVFGFCDGRRIGIDRWQPRRRSTLAGCIGCPLSRSIL